VCDVELIAGDVFEERETEQEDLNRQTQRNILLALLWHATTTSYYYGHDNVNNYYKLLQQQLQNKKI